MALANYDDLKASVADWMRRSDLTGNVADFIKLAEAKLNRDIPAVTTDVTLTGTADSRRIDVSANSVVSPLALFLVESNGDEDELLQKADGTFEYTATSDKPKFWAMDGDYIDFDCPLDTAYTFRFRIRQRYALSDAAPTNWLLTNHPDIYLAASLIWGGGYTRNWPYAQAFMTVLREGVPSVKRIIMEQSRAKLTVDPALTDRRRGGYYDWTNS